MTSRLEQRELVGGEPHDFNEPVIRGLVVEPLAVVVTRAARPGMSPSPVARDVEEEDGVDLLLAQLRRYVLPIAFQRDKLGEVLPLPLQEVLPACLAVEHFVPQTGIELLRSGLCKKKKKEKETGMGLIGLSFLQVRGKGGV